MKQALSLVVLVGFAAPGWSDDKQDAKAIQGNWLPVSAELGGEKFPLKNLKLTLTDGQYVVEIGKVSDKGTFTLDSAKKPATMDIKGTEGPNKGKTFLAIYELSGDTLKVCYDLEGKNRPKEFTSPAKTPTFLVLYKREKQ